VALISAVATTSSVGMAGLRDSPTRSATVSALRLTYPASFARRYFTSCAYMVTGVRGACVHGVFVASHRLPNAPERPGWQFLTREVVLELCQAPPQRYRNTSVVASVYAFPLSLADFGVYSPRVIEHRADDACLPAPPSAERSAWGVLCMAKGGQPGGTRSVATFRWWSAHGSGVVVPRLSNRSSSCSCCRSSSSRRPRAGAARES
jgi:hypothetical protein